MLESPFFLLTLLTTLVNIHTQVTSVIYNILKSITLPTKRFFVQFNYLCTPYTIYNKMQVQVLITILTQL